MRKFFAKFVFLFTLCLLNLSYLTAQEVEMADGMRSNGKIYVVVAVLAIILLGLFAFLINIDRKITRLEKEKNR